MKYTVVDNLVSVPRVGNVEVGQAFRVDCAGTWAHSRIFIKLESGRALCIDTLNLFNWHEFGARWAVTIWKNPELLLK